MSFNWRDTANAVALAAVLRSLLSTCSITYRRRTGETQEDGLKKYRTHCGEAGWKAVPYIEKLLKLAREKNLPVFYTVSERRPDMIDSGVQVGKSHRGTENTSTEGSHATQQSPRWHPSRRIS